MKPVFIAISCNIMLNYPILYKIVIVKHKVEKTALGDMADMKAHWVVSF